ncbi:MAG TPA: hypothetical protein VKG45_07635, partial [Actinomycetes bacterium]|nr:hypothetical protein [Actinomycetes bacterium]
MSAGTGRGRVVPGGALVVVRLLLLGLRLLAALLLLASILLLLVLVDLAAGAARAGATPALQVADPLTASPAAPLAARGAQDQLLNDRFEALQWLDVIDRTPGVRSAARAGVPDDGPREPGDPGPPLPPLLLAVLPKGLEVEQRPGRGLSRDGAGGGGPAFAAPVMAVVVGPARTPPGSQPPGPSQLSASSPASPEGAGFPPGLDKLVEPSGGTRPLNYALANRATGWALALPFPRREGLTTLFAHDAVTQHAITSQLTTLPETATGAAFIALSAYGLNRLNVELNTRILGPRGFPVFPEFNPATATAGGVALLLAEGMGKDWLQRHRVVLSPPDATRYGRPVWTSPAGYWWNLAYDTAVHFGVTAAVMGGVDHWRRLTHFRHLFESGPLEIGGRLMGMVLPATVRELSADLRELWRSPERDYLIRLFEGRVPAWVRWSPGAYGLLAGGAAAAGKVVAELVWNPPPGWFGDRLSAWVDQLKAAPSRGSRLELVASLLLNAGQWTWLTAVEAAFTSTRTLALGPLLGGYRLA